MPAFLYGQMRGLKRLREDILLVYVFNRETISMERITAPPALKKIFLGLINVAVFCFYYMLTCFLIGVVVGFSESIIDPAYSQSDSFTNGVLVVALGITVLASIFLRKKIYFRLTHVESPVEPPLAH